MSVKKFPKIKYPSDSETDGILDGEVVVLEKMDGANFRFSPKSDGSLLIGTRNHVYEFGGENVPHAFKHTEAYLDDVLPDEDILSQYSDYGFFGEAMHIHSLNYDDVDWEHPEKGPAHVPLDSDIPNIIWFDVYNMETDEWLDWDEVASLIDDLGLKRVPVLERGDPDDCDLTIPDTSVLGGEPEGIVVRRVDGSVRAKKVSESFQEQNAITFEDKNKAQTDAGTFVATYITEARIKKEAHKLIDRGEYDSMKMDMMQDLPKNVITDAIEENAWELISSGSIEVEWDDDFKGEVRSKASKKCARVLQELVNTF